MIYQLLHFWIFVDSRDAWEERKNIAKEDPIRGWEGKGLHSSKEQKGYFEHSHWTLYDLKTQNM